MGFVQDWDVTGHSARVGAPAWAEDSPERRLVIMKVRLGFKEFYNEQLFDQLSSKTRREETIVELREEIG